MYPLDASRIGHWYQADYLLTLLRNNADTRRTVTIKFLFYSLPQACNQQWLKMWKRELFFAPGRRILYAAFRLNNKIKNFEVFYPLTVVKIKEHSELSKIINNDHTLNIHFTNEEEAHGQLVLKSLGIKDGQDFVCFHSRDSAYMDSALPGFDWSYHNYRDSKISNYIPAMAKEAERGIKAVRVGAVVKEKLEPSDSIIDYANSEIRSDFADLYLIAKCKYFLGTDTGLTLVPEVFRRPVAIVNYVPIKNMIPTIRFGIFIPKTFYSNKLGRNLTFKEIFQSEMSTASDSKCYENNKVTLIENTPEQILDTTEEIGLRIEKKWKDTEEDRILQNKFWEIFDPTFFFSRDFTISTTYLRKNIEMLK